MADYIDKQDAIYAVHRAAYQFFCGSEDGDELSEDEKLVLSVNKAVCGEIKELPSTDAIEVVRCKDCKHWDISDIHSTICPDNRRCKGIFGKMYTEPDYYCAYGERKDKGGE